MKNFWQKLNTPILALAPMAGFTDSAFRKICRQYSADVVYSEMASVSGLFYSPPHQKELFKKVGQEKEFGVGASPNKTLELLKFRKYERPYVVQLFGSNPEHFAKATKIISNPSPMPEGRCPEGTERWERPDGIDINFGCPVKKVMKTGAGCALMLNYKLARIIIKSVCSNTDLPVSIKIRKGIRKVTAIDFIKKIKDLPFQAVMVHARTYEQGFSGMPNYSIAEKIKKIIPNKIVLINGGINSTEDAIKILKDYPVIDGLGIARGALGQPWIFEEIKKQFKNCREREFAFLKTGTHICVPYDKYNFLKTKKILLAHAQLIYKNKGAQGLKEFRAHIGWYIKGFPGASDLRKKLMKIQTLAKLKSELKKL